MKFSKTYLFIIMMLIIIPLSFALEFTENPSINNNQKPFLTNQDLTCSWTSTGNTSYDIKWFQSVGTGQPFNLKEGETTITLANSNVFRGHRWKCEVTIHDDITSISQNSSIVHLAPWLSFDDQITIVPDFHNLTEGTPYTFYVKSSEPGLVDVEFSISNQNPSELCSIVNAETGQITCLVEHKHVAGTTNPAPESITPFGMRISETTGLETFSSMKNLTLIPINNQADFVNFPVNGNLSLNALSPWSIQITGEDEETDYPLNFSVISYPGNSSEQQVIGLIFTNHINTAATLTFQAGLPTNANVGNWTINVSVTDNGSSDFPPSYRIFNMEIIRENYEPEITNITNTIGIQNMSFESFVYAQDNDTNDTLSFSIIMDLDKDPFCEEEYFKWNITTTNSSSSNATGRIFFENLTNDHVICRHAKIRVTDDTQASQTLDVFFNITNINDPPKIHEISNYEHNFAEQNNLSNISISLYAYPAFYKVNATDPDQLTYDVNNTGILTYSTNNSNFSINNQTGIINLTFTDTDLIGNHLVLVTVSDNGDDGGLNDSRIMNIQILNNTPPFIQTPEHHYFNQSNEVIIYFNTTEIDGDIIHLEFQSSNERFNSSIYNFTHTINNSYEQGIQNITIWSLNLTKWIMNKTNSHPIETRPSKELYENALVGTHNITIKAYDIHGAHNEEFSRSTLIFTINNENDVPFFDTVIRNNISDGHELTFSPMAVGSVYSRTIFVTDFDLYLPDYIYQENLTFLILDDSNLSSKEFVKNNKDSAILSFQPTQSGLNYINIRVEDKEGVGTTQRINFSVYEITGPPQFISVNPYYDDETILQFINVSSLTIPYQPLQITWEENSSLTFDADITIDPNIFSGGDPEPNALNIEWYVNNVLIEQLFNVDPKINSSFTYYFDFFSSGINNVTLKAIDLVGSTNNWTWQVNVENVNRPPIYCNNTLEDMSFSGSITWPNYLGFLSHQRFYDPDDDPNNKGPGSIDPCDSQFTGLYKLPSLFFSIEYYLEILQSECDAEFVFSGTNLTIHGRSRSTCQVKFVATDDYGEIVKSNPVFIEVLEATNQGEQENERIVRVTERITIPFEERVDVPTPTKIIYPGKAVFYQNQTIEVPLIIKNNWTEDFTEIHLSATALNFSSEEQDEELKITFSQNQIGLLPVDQEQEIKLYLTNYRTQGPIMINIFAEVTNPAFNDSDTLIIAGLERTGDDPGSVRSLVTYARDLLTSTPECAELNDLLDNALRLIEQGQTQDALRLVDGAINGCKYLLAQEEQLRTESPGTLKVGLDFTSENWSEIVLGSIALIFVAIVFYVFAFVRMSVKNK